jgi:dephospho-CoA kinase
VVVYDVPLLVEARADDPWDLIVVASAPTEVRARRLVEQRGMDAAAARARIDSQVSDEVRLRIADVVIDTSGTLEQTEAQADALWERLRSGLGGDASTQP